MANGIGSTAVPVPSSDPYNAPVLKSVYDDQKNMNRKLTLFERTLLERVRKLEIQVFGTGAP